MPIGSNILAGASGQATGYDIDQSLRFEDGDSAYLSRTLSSPTDGKVFTLSFWLKRGNIGTSVAQWFFSGSGGNAFLAGFNASSDALQVGEASTGYGQTTEMVFRDTSSWYAITIVGDSTQASNDNRIKIYVNGSAVNTTKQNTITQNSIWGINTVSATANVGRYTGASGYSDGYLAEVHFIDGQALTPASFGETNSDTNQWVPIEYTGSYGTNGFYLKFQDSSALGDDSSGNTNDFTPTNLAATDQVLDSPTNNFATLNPLATQTTPLSEGNLRKSTSDTKSNMSTIGVSSGKWYWEVYPETNNWGIGLVNDTETRQSATGSTTVAVLYSDVTSTGTPNSTETYDNFSSVSAGDIISIALDVDSETITFYQNNTRIFEADTFTIDGPFFPAIDRGTGATNNITINFGQDSSFAGAKTSGAAGSDFYYTPPTGYKALNTSNLSVSIADPTVHFSTTLWSGNDAASRAITTGVDADFVWYKERTGTESHSLYDSIRGAQKRLISNSTDLERTRSTGLQSFDSTGFTVGSDTECNGSGRDYVGWNWKAGGTASSNTDGSITSSVSANPTAGFSVLTYTGNATAGATVGHGLSQAPELVINKVRGLATQWYVNATAISDTSNKVLMLNDTSALDSGTVYFNDTDPTSTVVTLGSYSLLNSTGSNVIYCWHSVEGYSKVGSYQGNGNNDGPFIYTGFQPAFFLVKKYATVGGDNWAIYDNKRNESNVMNTQIYPDANSTEESSAARNIDFVSNGIKIRGTNSRTNDASTHSFLYMAFAEFPFKTSNAR